MNNDEKKKRMEKVCKALLEEHGLADMLTDEERQNLVRRAFKQQLDYNFDVMVRKVVDDLVKGEVEAARPAIQKKIDDYLTTQISGNFGIISQEVRASIRASADHIVLSAVRKTVEELRSKMKVNLNITFEDEKK